jgi:Kdo2-lipid IVA lauroyltransferase/acyltransferase
VPRPAKRLKRRLIFLLLQLAVLPLQLVPIAWGLAFGRFLGRIGAAIRGVERRRAEAQLQAALGLDPESARQLALRSFEHLGMVGAEIGMAPRLRRRLTEYVVLSDEARATLKSALAEGRGVLFVSGHLGNWELLAERIVAEGHPAATFARGAPNPYLGRWLLARREGGGVETINRGDPKAARQLLAILKKGGILGVLIDQDTDVDSVFVPFFGRVAKTPVVAAQLARSRKIPILVGAIRREGAVHRVSLERPTLLPDDDSDAWLIDTTAKLTACLEAAIKRSPSEWPWLHDRWRSKPDSSASGEVVAVAPGDDPQVEA